MNPCDLCGKDCPYGRAQYATGWGGVFSGGLLGPWVCRECAPPGAYAIAAEAVPFKLEPELAK